MQNRMTFEWTHSRYENLNEARRATTQLQQLQHGRDKPRDKPRDDAPFVVATLRRGKIYLAPLIAIITERANERRARERLSSPELETLKLFGRREVPRMERIYATRLALIIEYFAALN